MNQRTGTMGGFDVRRHGRILWAAVSVILLAGIVASLLIADSARRGEESKAVTHAQKVATGRLLPLLVSTDVERPVTGTRYEELSTDVERDVLDGTITGLTVWSTSGTALFSTDRDVVGTNPGEIRDEVKRASRGGAHGSVDASGNTFSSWVPLRLRDSGPIAAVAQLDRPYAPIWTVANRPWRVAAIALATGLLITLALLLLSFRDTSRPKQKAAARQPQVGGAEEAWSEQKPERKPSRDGSQEPVYTHPEFRRMIDTLRLTEERAQVAEKQYRALEEQFKRALEELRAAEGRAKQLETGDVPAGADPRVDEVMKRMEALQEQLREAEERASFAQERADAAEAALAQAQEQDAAAVDSVLGEELEHAQRTAREAAERAERAEASLHEAEQRSEALLREAEKRAEALLREAEQRAEAAPAEDLSGRIEELETSLRTAEERAAAAEQRVREAEVLAAQAQEQASQSATAGSEVEARLRQAEERAAQAEAAMSALEARAAKTQDDLARARDEAQRETALGRAQAEEQLSTTQQELTSTRDELTGTREELAGTREELAGTREELAGTREELTSTRDELTHTAEEATAAEAQVAAAVDERLQLAAARARDSEERAGAMQAQLEQANAKVRELEELVAGTDDDRELVRLQEELANTHERLKASSARLLEMEERARAAERSLEQLQTQAIARDDRVATLDRVLHGGEEPAPLGEERRASVPFVEAISRDARASINSILGLALTAKHTAEPDDLQPLLRQLTSQARKLDQLVADILHADRLAAGTIPLNRRRTDLDALVRRVVEESGIEADRDVRMHSERAAVSVDPQRIEQVVSGMLDTALVRTSPGSSVYVRVERGENGVMVAVEDDQPAPDAELSPIITRFTEMHGGRVEVAARIGGGTSFRVHLPDPDDAADPGRETSEERDPESNGRTPTVDLASGDITPTLRQEMGGGQ